MACDGNENCMKTMNERRVNCVQLLWVHVYAMQNKTSRKKGAIISVIRQPWFACAAERAGNRACNKKKRKTPHHLQRQHILPMFTWESFEMSNERTTKYDLEISSVEIERKSKNTVYETQYRTIYILNWPRNFIFFSLLFSVSLAALDYYSIYLDGVCAFLLCSFHFNRAIRFSFGAVEIRGLAPFNRTVRSFHYNLFLSNMNCSTPFANCSCRTRHKWFQWIARIFRTPFGVEWVVDD